MDIKTINLKKIITKNNVDMIDFAEPSYIPQYDSKDFLVTKQVQLTSLYNHRADLVSLALYNSDDYLDIILKCNEISDPLSINENDLIIVPYKSKASKFYITPSKEKKLSNNDNKPSLDSSKKSKVDSKRIDELNRIKKLSNTINFSKQNLKTNQLKNGEENIGFDGTNLLL